MRIIKVLRMVLMLATIYLFHEFRLLRLGIDFWKYMEIIIGANIVLMIIELTRKEK